MSNCLDSNPCDPCVGCVDTSPCYDDCGCLNPTTWACITKPGNHPAIGVVDSMTGTQVLAAINATISNLTIPEGSTLDDKYVKNSVTDTTANYLSNKIAQGSFMKIDTIFPSGNEQLRINADLAKMISTNVGNQLDLGTDGKFRVLSSESGTPFVFAQGTGIQITGTGVVGDPAVFSTNPSIQVARSCFDSVWKSFTLSATGNTSVVHIAGDPKYRITHTGTVEFKGSMTYTVSFGNYSSATRKFSSIPLGTLPTTCLSSGELSGVADLKSINYIDAPQATTDQFSQQYGFVLKRSGANLLLDFQSSFTNSTSRTISINLDGVVIHPNL